jgi:hypothetical protein
MKILKPSTQPASVSIRVPADVAQRLSTVKAAAAQRGLSLDVDQPLAKALARLVRQAEAELESASSAESVQQAGQAAEVPYAA